MVRAAGQLIRAHGVSATGMRSVVATAEAPRGSLQHYFPGGKDQLVGEALRSMGEVAAHRVSIAREGLAEPSPQALFEAMVGGWRAEFLTYGFERGCPLVAAAADVAASSEELRRVIATAFERWRDELAQALCDVGLAPERAGAVSTLLISALEGAIVLSRVRRDVEPLDHVVAELAPLLQAAVAHSTIPTE